MGNPVRRDLLPIAFARALDGEHGDKIDLSPVTGMTIDAAFLILKRTELFRDTYGNGPGEILRANVRRAARASGLPIDRAYAYEVVAMNYYAIIKEFQAAQRKRRAA